MSFNFEDYRHGLMVNGGLTSRGAGPLNRIRRGLVKSGERSTYDGTHKKNSPADAPLCHWKSLIVVTLMLLWALVAGLLETY